MSLKICTSGRIWARVGEIITATLQDESFEVDARRCRERTMLLLDYYKKQDFPSLRRWELIHMLFDQEYQALM